MKIQPFNWDYGYQIAVGGTDLAGASGSNSTFGGDVVGDSGALSVVGLRSTVSLSSNLGAGNAIGDVLALVNLSPLTAQFSTPSNSGGGSFGSNATRVSAASFVGASANGSREDHRHDGIGTVTASSSNTLDRGTLNLRPGSGVTFGLTDSDGSGGLDTLTINSTATGGGGGGGGGAASVGGYFVYPLDRTLVSGLNGTYGDDFTSASLNGRWTRATQTSGEESYQQGPRGSHLTVAYSTGAASRYLWQDISGLGTSWTFEAAASIWGDGTGGTMAGLMALDSSGNGVCCFFYFNAAAFYIGNVAAGGYSSIGAQTLLPTSLPISLGSRVWYRLRRSGSTYSASWSPNGETYSPELAYTPSAFTQARIGFGRILGTTAGHTLDLDWFDKTA